MGFIIRANSKYQIYEDLWCLYYPEDINQQFIDRGQQLLQYHQQQQAGGTASNHVMMANIQLSFAAFLAQLFPQLQTILLQMIQQHYQPQQQQQQQMNGFASSLGKTNYYHIIVCIVWL